MLHASLSLIMVNFEAQLCQLLTIKVQINSFRFESEIGSGSGITKILKSGIGSGIGITISGIGSGIGITKKISDSNIPVSHISLFRK